MGYIHAAWTHNVSFIEVCFKEHSVKWTLVRLVMKIFRDESHHTTMYIASSKMIRYEIVWLIDTGFKILIVDHVNQMYNEKMAHTDELNFYWY